MNAAVSTAKREGSAVSVRDLGKSYGDKVALQGISFEAAPGEIFGLLGPNGAGKTSCLECILGLRQPDSGEIFIGEIDVVKYPLQAKRELGALLQSASLQDVITAREALKLFASFYDDVVSVEELVSRFEISEFADRRFAGLSGGQRQRLFLALAFVNRPRVVVLDEPSAGLDPLSRRELHRSIRSARDAGCTVILSTHYLEEAEQLCDRVAIVDGGRIAATDTIPRLLSGAGAISRIAVEFTPHPSLETWRNVKSVVSATQSEGSTILETTDVAETLGSLAQLAKDNAAEVRDLRVLRPTLEDVFLQVTGRAYPETNDKVK